MSTRVDQEAQLAGNPSPLAVTVPAAPTLAPLDYDDRWGGQSLPGDHPQWMKDTLSISQRARALIARLKPVVIKVIAYWEHRVRSVAIGKERLSIDASGCYRLD